MKSSVGFISSYVRIEDHDDTYQAGESRSHCSQSSSHPLTKSLAGRTYVAKSRTSARDAFVPSPYEHSVRSRHAQSIRLLNDLCCRRVGRGRR